ncbi:MAG: hypothetical protein BGO98_41695 [Myxococcales bacterium 68-20]|nr:hypothetical protein [Myxococcales bacterium]OJY27772.1 MAG: hypothetical protein BGO98_41695 [Myxococcales bacterium 68-20]
MREPTEAPPRYADLGASEGRLLDLLRTPEMSAEQIARCERRVVELAKAPPAPTATGTGALKIAAVALVVVPLTLFGLSELRDVDRPLVRSVQVEAPLPATTSTLPSTEALPTIDVDSLPTAAESAPKLAEPRTTPTPRAPTDRLARELALLDHARAVLGTAPEAALRDVDRHARDFSDGQLVAEREVIAVDALKRLGRMSEARARGKAFSERAPGTSAARRIDTLLDGLPAHP